MCAALSLSIDAIKPLNRWDYSSIRPGVVGSVGDVNLTTRYKSSLPGDFRWDPESYGNKESLYGSSVNNGSQRSFNSGGGPAHTVDSNWGGRRNFKTRLGYIYQDMRAPDKLIEPVMGSTPQYSWRNKIATNYRARTTGDLFPIPRGGVLEQPNGVTRGGMYPRVTDVVTGAEDAGFAPNNITQTGPPLSEGRFVNHKPTSSFTTPYTAEELANKERARGTLGRFR